MNQLFKPTLLETTWQFHEEVYILNDSNCVLNDANCNTSFGN